MKCYIWSVALHGANNVDISKRKSVLKCGPGGWRRSFRLMA